MSVESEMNEGLKTLYGTEMMGKAITYTPPGGSAVYPNAMIDDETVDTTDTVDGRYQVYRRTFHIIVDSDGINQTPVNGATITHNGTDYNVDSIGALDETFAALECIRDEPTAKRHESFNKDI